jgi:VanZ family protein
MKKALAILWTIIIIILCSLPGKDLPSVDILNFDKVAHFGVMWLWAILWMWDKPSHSLIFIAILGGVFGTAIEFYQERLPWERSFDWFDALADFIGACLGALTWWIGSKFMKARNV